MELRRQRTNSEIRTNWKLEFVDTGRIALELSLIMTGSTSMVDGVRSVGKPGQKMKATYRIWGGQAATEA